MIICIKKKIHLKTTTLLGDRSFMNLNIRKILNSIYLVSFIITIFVMISSPRIKSSNVIDFQDPIVADNITIQYVDKSDNIKKTLKHSLPYTIKTDKVFSVIVNLNDFDKLEDKSFNIFSLYSDFECYIDGKMIYSNYTSNSELLYSSGTLVNYVIDFPKDIKEKILTIYYKPTLKYNKNVLIHPISIGYRTNFFTTVIVKNELVSIVISLFLIFVFFISIILVIFFIKSPISRKIILNIGLLAFLFSVYSFTEYRSILYIFSKYRLLIYYLEYISFLLIPFPIINLINIYTDVKYSFLLFIIKNIILLNWLVQIILTSTKIIEFKDLLPFSTLLIIVTCITSLILLFISKNREKEKKRVLFSLIPVLIILLVGIGAYNIIGQFEISSLILILTMTFIFIQMASLISKYTKVMQENEKIEKYKALVSYDTMTLMCSRHSFEEHISSLRVSPRDTTFISADLNNLKLVNDNLGHNYGDVAIIEAGRFLHNNFSDSQIYRIGGDEYVVIHEGIIDESYIESVQSQNMYIKDISEKIDISLSIGYFNFYVNNKEGYSIDDALKFSDIYMYENKRIYKKSNNNSDKNKNKVN